MDVKRRFLFFLPVNGSSFNVNCQFSRNLDEDDCRHYITIALLLLLLLQCDHLMMMMIMGCSPKEVNVCLPFLHKTTEAESSLLLSVCLARVLMHVNLLLLGVHCTVAACC